MNECEWCGTPAEHLRVAENGYRVCPSCFTRIERAIDDALDGALDDDPEDLLSNLPPEADMPF